MVTDYIELDLCLDSKYTWIKDQLRVNMVTDYIELYLCLDSKYTWISDFRICP